MIKRSLFFWSLNVNVFIGFTAASIPLPAPSRAEEMLAMSLSAGGGPGAAGDPVSTSVGGPISPGESVSAGPVQTPPPDPAFEIRSAYAYPNPARIPEKPVIRVETGSADSLSLSLYTLNGRLVHEALLTGPQDVYEYAWDPEGVRGIYICRIVAKKEGRANLKKTIKLAVTR